MAAQLMRNHQQQQFGGGTPQLQNQQHQTAGLQAVLAQQQAQQNIGNFYDRPSSSASATHSQGSQQFNPQQSPHAQQFPLQQTSTPFQMMPPPPPRPPSSRPGTSNSHPSHHSGQPLQVAGPQSPSLGGGAPMQRPPSRPRTSSGVSPFAPQGQPQPMMKPPTPIQPAPPQAQVHTPTHMNSPFQPQGGAGPFGSVPATPTPGSPGRKRKLTGPDGMQMNASPQYGMSGGGLGGLGMSMSNGAVNAGGGGLMAASSGNLANLPLSASNSAAYMGGAGGGLMGPPHVVPARAGSLGLPHSADSPNPLLAAVQAPLLAQHTPALNAAFLPGTAIPGLPDVRQRQPSLDAAAFADLPGPSTRGHTAMLTSPAVQAKLPTPMQTPVRPTASVTQAAPAPSTSYPALPAFPGSASLNAKTTRVTIVDPGDVRDLTEEEIANVKVWSERDKAYDVVYRGMKDRVNDELRDLRASAGTMWWEAGDGRKLRTKFGVTYPGQRARENRKRGRREGFKL
ncbi:hypothetical protein FA95DRAFT_1077890 [Auriscalpium vulgare]|uniref:Uncharacterized protein n=1 Tax=Auriscalpium vulgare TaxID=40419 RepID=A0ACB8R528_9AGAM|nr:hypothetical protein FA95DRAFT_1077890 [Auriscalpium vulgare]